MKQTLGIVHHVRDIKLRINCQKIDTEFLGAYALCEEGRVSGILVPHTLKLRCEEMNIQQSGFWHKLVDVEIAYSITYTDGHARSDYVCAKLHHNMTTITGILWPVANAKNTNANMVPFRGLKRTNITQFTTTRDEAESSGALRDRNCTSTNQPMTICDEGKSLVTSRARPVVVKKTNRERTFFEVVKHET